MLNSPGRLLKPHPINKFPLKSILLGGEMVPTCFSSSPFTLFVFLISDESQNQASLSDREKQCAFSSHKVAGRPNIVSHRRQHQEALWGQSPFVGGLNLIKEKMKKKSCRRKAETAIFPEEEKKKKKTTQGLSHHLILNLLY